MLVQILQGSTTTTTLEFDRNVAEDPNDETRTAVGAAGEWQSL